MIPTRIRHLGVCEHAQTPYARRKCRAAKIAAIVVEQAAKPAYRAGDELDIDGTLIILGSRRGNTGIRWSWYAPAIEADGEAYYPTPEEAVADARRSLGSERCSCGAVATMHSSTRRTCAACYDRYAA